MSTYNILFRYKIRKFPLIFVFMNDRRNFIRIQKRVRVSHDKRVICVRAIEVRLKEVWIHFVNLPLFHKGDNFCDFLFTFLHTNSPPQKESSLTGKNLLPEFGSKFFPVRVDPFSVLSWQRRPLFGRRQNNFDRVTCLEIVSNPCLVTCQEILRICSVLVNTKQGFR